MGSIQSLPNHLTQCSDSSNHEGNPTKVLMLGLDGTGKTTCLFNLRYNMTVTIVPTVGFQVETVTPLPGLSFTVWDFSGREQMRAIRKHYYGMKGMLGVIFVVDSQDRQRFTEAREELLGILQAQEMTKNVPVLILANKQDLPDACSIAELTDELQLHSLTQNPWHIQDWSDPSEQGGNPTTVLMLGLDGTGKTTCLYRLKDNITITTFPTVGFNVETVTPLPGLSFTVWDLSGHEQMRALWKHYYDMNGMLGVIFVVDSQDREKFEDTRRVLIGILRDPQLTRNIPLLILANKQDLPDACSVSELTDELQLQSLTQNPWHIQGTCATTGDGLCEGFRHLSRMIRVFRVRHWGKSQKDSEGQGPQ